MRVVIVGAGPGGAATALLLARRGHAVTLVEREAAFDRVFRGEALMPHGLDALAQMGLAADVEALPGGPFEAWRIHLDRRFVMELREPSLPAGLRPPRIVAPGALIESLVSEARRASGAFELVAPFTVRQLVREGARVVGIRGEGPQGPRELRADLVIGADGRTSVVRHRAELPLDLLPESYDIVWFRMPPPPDAVPSSMSIYASGPDGALAYTSWDGSFQVAWMLPKASWNEVRDRDWLEECLALMPEELAIQLRAQREDLVGPTLLDVVVGRCPRWWTPGVLLLGDAAHPMSPIRAQGINMALRDAIVLANHLGPALDAGTPAEVDAACAAVQREREPEIRTVQKLQIREVRGQRWARSAPWLMRPLLALAPHVAHAGFVQWLWGKQQLPLRVGITSVRLDEPQR